MRLHIIVFCLRTNDRRSDSRRPIQRKCNCIGIFKFDPGKCDYVSLVPTKAYMHEIDGVEKSFSVWCNEYGKQEKTVRRLMRQGMSLKDALNCGKTTKRTQYTVNGFTGTFAEVCRHFGIRDQTVSYRMKHMGMSLEEAIFSPIMGCKADKQSVPLF